MRVKPDLTYETFIAEVNDYHQNVIKEEQPDARYGQTLFNCLWKARPDISEQLRGHRLDPFYTTDVQPETFTFIQERW